MENATKALLIAASILITIMVVTLLLMLYNQISSYYNTLHEEKEVEQLADFNKIFENYHRENIRGTELLSLMNRVIDYNERLTEGTKTEYPRIVVQITIGAVKSFKYNENDDTIFGAFGNANNNNYIIKNNKEDELSDKNLIAVTEIENELINRYSEYNLTSTSLQRLSADISNICLGNAPTKNAKMKRENILKNTLKISSVTDDNIDDAIDIATKYYQLTQFKRAMFNCKKISYDKFSGRINEMFFEVQRENDQLVLN